MLEPLLAAAAYCQFHATGALLARFFRTRYPRAGSENTTV